MLNYKKPAFWIVLVAIIALIVTAVCFLTDPVQKQNDIFGATYQAETVIYRHPTLPYNYGTGETPLYHPTPEGGLRVMEDRCANIWHTVGNFSEVSLPKLNFADWFEYAGFAWEGEPSVEFIANTNRTAWILYADDPETGSRTDFYCLLQQENEDIYLLQGLYNAGQYRAQWLFLLEEFDYDSSTYFPLRWLHDLLPGDGIQTQLTTHFHEEEDEAITLCTTESNMLRRLLIHLKADQIAPGTLTGDTAMEASVKCQNESYPDVLLQYDGEAVQLTFTGNGAREGDWIIHSVALNEFFESYAQWNPAENPFIAPDSAAHFCQNITAEYVDYVFASETIAAGALFHQAQAVHLDRQQIGELLGILNDLPEAAFEAAEYPEDANQVLEIYCRNLWNDETLYPMGQLHILNGWVYFTFYFHVEAPYQTWKIDSSDLVAFIESLYEGERSGWETFAPYPASDGEVSCDFGGVEVIIPRLTCFHYEVGEESIRFKPEDQEGWVLIQYRTEPFGVCGTGLQTDEVSYKNGETFGVQGYYDGSDVWSFMSLTATSGDMVYNVVLLNEASAPWVTEYDSEISKLLNELNFLVMPSEG